LFIVPSTTDDKQRTEMLVREEMSVVTGDEKWKDRGNVKTLTLEHHMAAKRMGFFEMFGPLSTVSEFRTGLIDGSLPLIRFFYEQVLPLVVACRKDDQFTSAAIVRKLSPLLRREAFLAAKEQRKQLTMAKAAVVDLGAVCDPLKSATFQHVLDCVAKSRLFEIPDTLFPFVTAEKVEEESGSATEEPKDERALALRGFLAAPFAQIEPYAEYVGGAAIFGTHQGVKGLEFPRVVVVMDDEEARGFMFSYEKLFGVKEKSKTDIENEKTGDETSVERTRRLFYVTCSRSEESLALVAYTANTDALRKSAIAQGWFEEDEVVLLAV
jgi:DNA helicase-2/ATP-dependent DNA helicase PcrA